MPITKRPYKPINVHENDWNEYNQAAIALSAERGKRISIPDLLKEAYAVFIQKV